MQKPKTSLWRQSGLQSVRRSVEPRPLLCIALDGQSGREHELQRQRAHGKWYGRQKHETASSSFTDWCTGGSWRELQQTLVRAHAAAQSQGSRVTRVMRAWRGLGRAMTDIIIPLFNLGRTDFRKQNLSAYALEVQSSLSVAVASTKQVVVCGENVQSHCRVG